MIPRRDSFKLGLFVIAGVLLLFVVLFALGVGKFFHRTYQMETYIDESVNGLEVGSQVKFRGVRVGSVSEIGFVSEKYGARAAGCRYIYVLCTLDKNLFGSLGPKPAREQAADEVARGLRVRPISQGLTGQLVLGLDYVSPASNPPLPINWTPESIYVPAAPSTLSRVEQAVLSISNSFAGLGHSDLPDLVHSFHHFADSASAFLNSADMKQVGPRLAATLTQSQKLLARLNALLSDPSAKTIVPNAAGTLAGMRRLVDTAGPDAAAFLHDARDTAASLKKSARSLELFLDDPVTKRQLAAMPETLRQARETVAQLRSASIRLNAVLGRVEELTAAQQANIEAVLSGARDLVDNLNELTGEAKRYPAGMLFGPPPQKSRPDRTGD